MPDDKAQGSLIIPRSAFEAKAPATSAGSRLVARMIWQREHPILNGLLTVLFFAGALLFFAALLILANALPCEYDDLTRLCR